ncbi:NAD(P)/FAD-dependent oxidoreductase [Paenibacillus koleovorans]|uniref:NAD(P)/FAD-dependent oxidoreductase n=1 Tax=Paenibacillus koleovorans TaxID=121608 RepID=UPI000FD8A39F|nr:FAD-dependent oxidoreductase [Paenibacillus koleovorans]
MYICSENTLWKAIAPPPRSYPILEEDLECDVLVIGGGMCGALVASLLMEQQVDTVLVDKRGIAEGSTAANIGLLQFSNDKSLSACMRTFGEERGLRFYRRCAEALDELERLAAGLADRADFVRRPSLYFASEANHLPALREEYETLKQHGFAVDIWDQDRITEHYAFSKPGAIYYHDDAELDPYRFVHGLLDAARDRGLRIYTHTEVFGQAEDRDALVFHTGRHRIRAKYAVCAAGCEAQQIKRTPNAEVTSTFAIATPSLPAEAFKGWHARSLIWETARPYLYLRTTADNRILVGGLDDSFTLRSECERMLPRKRELLLEAMRRLFPALGEVTAEYAWCGALGSSHDGMPMIGRQAGFPGRCYFMLGYGGNGTVYGMIGAKLIADWIVEGQSPDADLFRFDR